MSNTKSFYRDLPIHQRFADLADPSIYQDFPGDWCIALADIVDSTVAISEGNYKKVNMAGASLISAMRNSLGEQELPTVFGGDGAAVALPAEKVEIARDVLLSCQQWVEEALGLKMRVALASVAAINGVGHAVRVARFAPSEHVDYAMFDGGGLAWAEQAMKNGEFQVTSPKPIEPPNLEGLSCRWHPIGSNKGQIVSIIILPKDEHDDDFTTLTERALAIFNEENDRGSPVPAEGPDYALWSKGIDLEVATEANPANKASKKRWVRFVTIFAWCLAKFNIDYKGFSASRYAEVVSSNTDFRKFDDGLKMTVDCDNQQLAQLENLLIDGHQAGTCFYGLHCQDEALITCIVPSPMDNDHIHFVDGAKGGYAVAAIAMKEQMKAV
jgi:hypothetical protein